MEELITKAREIRERRELEIYLSSSEFDPNILEKNFVKKIEYLGEVKIANSQDEEKQYKVFKVIEQNVTKDGEIIETEKFYTENFILLGVNNKTVYNYGVIFLTTEFLGDTNLIDQLIDLQQKTIDMDEEEDKQLKDIAMAVGIAKEKIESMSEVELVKEIENKEDAKGTEQKEEKEIDKEQFNQINNEKQEIKLNTKVDDKKTLGQALDLDESEFTKVAIVYSERLKEISKDSEDINNTMYSFVAIRKDGTAMNINDRLQLDSRTGNNSTRESIKIDADEQARKDDKTKTRFQIIGQNGNKKGIADSQKETLSVENGQYGEIKAYYGKGRSRENNENLEIQLETSNVRPTSIELRKMQADRKGIYNTDKMVEEADTYLNGQNNEKVSMYNVDGDEYTLADGVDIFVDKNVEEWASIIMDDPDVDKVFTTEEVKQMIKKYWLNGYAENAKKDDGKITKDEIKNINEEIKEKIIQDAEMLNRQNKR